MEALRLLKNLSRELTGKLQLRRVARPGVLVMQHAAVPKNAACSSSSSLTMHTLARRCMHVCSSADIDLGSRVDEVEGSIDPVTFLRCTTARSVWVNVHDTCQAAQPRQQQQLS